MFVSLPITDICATLIFAFKNVPMLFICKNVFQGPLIPFIRLLNVNSSGTIRGDIFMQCHFPSLQGKADAFTPSESPIYNLLCCCLRQFAPPPHPSLFPHILLLHHVVWSCAQWTLAAFLLHAVLGDFSSLSHHIAAVILLSSVFCGYVPR